jgi:hypothetical protein
MTLHPMGYRSCLGRIEISAKIQSFQLHRFISFGEPKSLVNPQPIPWPIQDGHHSVLG